MEILKPFQAPDRTTVLFLIQLRVCLLTSKLPHQSWYKIEV